MKSDFNIVLGSLRAVFVTCDLVDEDIHPSFDFMFNDCDDGGTLVNVQYGDDFEEELHLPCIEGIDILPFCTSFALRACLPFEVAEVRANFYNPLYEVDE